MTKPTIEQIIGALNEIFSDVDMDKHRESYEMLREHIFTQQASTLPLDEVPEEFRDSEILISPPFGNKKNWYVEINHSHGGDGDTAIEAFRATTSSAGGAGGMTKILCMFGWHKWGIDFNAWASNPNSFTIMPFSCCRCGKVRRK